MKRFALLIAGMITALWPNTIPAQTVNVGTCEWTPWQIMEGGLVKGITPDILQEIVQRTGLTMNIRPLPQKRMMVAFETGKIDMEPAVNPAWRKDHREISVYTRPFYITGDVILVRKENNLRGSSVKDFHGLKLGCGLGYYYPEGFQEAFERGDILREDNPASKSNLVKLSLNRIDGLIVDKIQARYIMKKVKLDPADFVTAYAFKPSALCLRLHKNREDLLPVLNATLAQMEADGTIDRIVAGYLY